MNTNAFRVGMAAVVIVLVAIVGFTYFSGQNIGEDPDTTASPSLTETPGTAGPMSLLDAPEDTSLLPPGDYYLDLPTYPARIDFTVPEGWRYFSSGATRATSDSQAILVDSVDTGAATGSAWGISFTVVARTPMDPCHPPAGMMPSLGLQSPDALALRFGNWSGFSTTVQEVTVGGFSGKRVEITRAETTTCKNPLAFITPAGYEFVMQGPSSLPVADQFTFLDVPGGPVLVIWTTDFPATSPVEVGGGASPDPEAHVADQVDLQAILDSIVITLR